MPVPSSLKRNMHFERKAYVKEIGLDPEDTKRWEKKFIGLKNRAYSSGLGCYLTFEEYVGLAKEAGLVNPDEIGRTLGKYQMGRLGDIGPYEIGNCRFITMSQNLEEKQLNGGCVGSTKPTGPRPIEYILKHARAFRVISPTGEIFEGVCMAHFADEHNLSRSSMGMVCRGNIPHYKRWTGSYID